MEALFESENYKRFLDTMSKFHNYSFNNSILIANQKPESTLVAGYEDWQKKFHRQVKRGEKGITILAPVSKKIKKWVDEVDENGFRILTTDGRVKQKQVEEIIYNFRAVSVFDVSQTEGEPLPSLGIDELQGDVKNYENIQKALIELSPVPVRFDEIKGEAKGYYSSADKEIVIQIGMSEAQRVKTLLHEISHAVLHDKEGALVEGVGDEEKSRRRKEVEAESCAYVISQHLGLDTSEYSFGYIAGWSSDKEMKELKQSLITIRRTADHIITGLDDILKKILELKKLESEKKVEEPEKKIKKKKSKHM